MDKIENTEKTFMDFEELKTIEGSMATGMLLLAAEY